jgi:ubiquinone/menaquinone biosynthesis C-methylase UbiE/predicted transcriptional regulator
MKRQSIKEEIQAIRQLWTGFMPARVLLTANNLEVFEHLKSWKSLSEVASTLKTDKRGTELLLNALVSLGVLKKQANKYKNTPLARKYLTRESPYYQGNIIKHADSLWRSWSELDKAVRTGKPTGSDRDFESFILGMHDIAKIKCKEVVDNLPLKGVVRALDLGGGPGTYSMELAKRGIRVTLFDRAETLKIAKRLIKESGIEGIDFIAGDFMKDPIGKGYDFVFISQILHAYSEKDSLFILKKVKKALNKGGKVVVQEFFVNPAHTSPLWGAIFAINMLVNTTGGMTYSPAEIKGWLKKAGFRSSTSKRLNETVLITGRM